MYLGKKNATEDTLLLHSLAWLAPIGLWITTFALAKVTCFQCIKQAKNCHTQCPFMLSAGIAFSVDLHKDSFFLSSVSVQIPSLRGLLQTSFLSRSPLVIVCPCTFHELDSSFLHLWIFVDLFAYVISVLPIDSKILMERDPSSCLCLLHSAVYNLTWVSIG